MDPLAHTLFGATMAEAGLKRKTALATATLIIGANIPDVDALALFVSQDYALEVRRGWTHGILAMMVWPFLLTGAMLTIDRLLRNWRDRGFSGRNSWFKHRNRLLRYRKQRLPASKPVESLASDTSETTSRSADKLTSDTSGTTSRSADKLTSDTSGTAFRSADKLTSDTSGTLYRTTDSLKSGSSGASYRPPMRPGVLLGIAFLGVWSHPLLDWVNTYGIRLLMPFSDTWFYGDTLFIIDPWMWLLAGAGVVLARSKSWPGITGWIVLGTAITALVTVTDMVPKSAKIVWLAGIGVIILLRWTDRHYRIAQPAALTLLAATLIYMAFMLAGARITASHARTHLAAQGTMVEQVMPNPLPARPFMRSGVAASPDYYYLFTINWLRPGSFELTGPPVPVQPPDPIAEAALEAPGVQGFRGWMRFPVYEVRRLDDGWRVFIRDLRYVTPDQELSPGIGMTVVDLDEDLKVLRVR